MYEVLVDEDEDSLDDVAGSVYVDVLEEEEEESSSSSCPHLCQ